MSNAREQSIKEKLKLIELKKLVERINAFLKSIGL